MNSTGRLLEPEDEFLRVHDPGTGGVIVCCNRMHVGEERILRSMMGGRAARVHADHRRDEHRPRSDSLAFALTHLCRLHGAQVLPHARRLCV